MSEYIVMVDEGRRPTGHPNDPLAWLFSLPCLEGVTRCADCKHCKQVSDRSGVYCELWRHRTRLDGYCHMGEVE